MQFFALTILSPILILLFCILMIFAGPKPCCLSITPQILNYMSFSFYSVYKLIPLRLCNCCWCELYPKSWQSLLFLSTSISLSPLISWSFTLVSCRQVGPSSSSSRTIEGDSTFSPRTSRWFFFSSNNIEEDITWWFAIRLFINHGTC